MSSAQSEGKLLDSLGNKCGLSFQRKHPVQTLSCLYLLTDRQTGLRSDQRENMKLGGAGVFLWKISRLLAGKRSLFSSYESPELHFLLCIVPPSRRNVWRWNQLSPTGTTWPDSGNGAIFIFISSRGSGGPVGTCCDFLFAAAAVFTCWWVCTKKKTWTLMITAGKSHKQEAGKRKMVQQR